MADFSPYSCFSLVSRNLGMSLFPPANAPARQINGRLHTLATNSGQGFDHVAAVAAVFAGMLAGALVLDFFVRELFGFGAFGHLGAEYTAAIVADDDSRGPSAGGLSEGVRAGKLAYVA